MWIYLKKSMLFDHTTTFNGLNKCRIQYIKSIVTFSSNQIGLLYDISCALIIIKQQMRLIKFLSLLERIIIVLIILCFIPIAIFAYLPHSIIIPSAVESAYQQVKAQASTSGFLTDMTRQDQCKSVEMLALINEQCLQRCTMGSNCILLSPTQPCPYANSYIINKVQYCSTQPVLNQFVPADTVNFISNQQKVPLASITMNSNLTLVINYYCLNSLAQCSSLTTYFGHNVSDAFIDNYHTFSVVVQYLMLFGLLPLIVHTVVVLFLDSCCKFNLRLSNSLMIIHEALIGAGIIIAGISYNLTNDDLREKVNHLASQCLVGSTQCQSMQSPFANLVIDDGVSSTFVTIMCFVLAVEILLLIGVVVLNVLMVKYYKLREIDPSFSGYELQTL